MLQLKSIVIPATIALAMVTTNSTNTIVTNYRQACTKLFNDSCPHSSTLFIGSYYHSSGNHKTNLLSKVCILGKEFEAWVLASEAIDFTLKKYYPAYKAALVKKRVLTDFTTADNFLWVVDDANAASVWLFTPSSEVCIDISRVR